MYKTNLLKRLLFLAIAVLMIAAMPNMRALAALQSCRSDPHFKLSNGDMITVTVDVGTDIANIRSIDYILHVPPGVTITKVTYTAKSDKKEIKETYLVYQDSPAKTYTTETIVTTQTPGLVEVTVFTRANGVKETSVSGYSSQHLFITVSR